ncbi:type II toxin-antitoxin system VapC family toxin [Streptosporangium canum]|uniref:type II toxin-antitoxin system VapC family toxin n=1 Tax=Streptosporangium canum TaxID=324952 RepID=UPI00343DC992
MTGATRQLSWVVGVSAVFDRLDRLLPLQPRVLELRNNLTAYDGMYVALAELLGVPLLTDDAKFAGSTGHRAETHRYPPPLV